MKSALIGYSGFVGSNIALKYKFTNLYNSKNIKEILNKDFDLVVSAGVSGTKWKANDNPVKDLQKIKEFIKDIKTVKAKKFVLISTEDVYKNPYKVNEKTIINSRFIQPYGKNRLFLENALRNIFRKSLIVVRLPGLIGKNLKKNFIHDFINKEKYYLSNSDSLVQIYNLDYFWKDMKIVLKYSFPIINFSTEPVRIGQIIKYSFGINFINKDKEKYLNYDVRTIYGKYFKKEKYLYNKQEVLNYIKEFVNKERIKLEGRKLKKMKDVIY